MFHFFQLQTIIDHSEYHKYHKVNNFKKDYDLNTNSLN